jgi:Flp pilus assembly protein TadD
VIGLRLSLGVVLAVSVGGCASGGALTLSDRFVRPGTPAVDLGGPPLVASGPAKAANPLQNKSINYVSSRSSMSLSAVESANPELRDAMLRLMLAPTADHHLQVARAYRKIGIFDTAHDYLARSLTLNGPTPVVHDALARLWRDWGQPGLGLSHAYQAIHLAPGWAVGQNTLGTLLFRLGHRADARERFEAAVEIDPGAAYALENLCTVYLAEGRTRDAITACRQAEAARRRRPSPVTHPESR